MTTLRQDHSSSERRLHRALYVLKYSRLLFLFVIVAIVSAVVTAATGATGFNAFSDAAMVFIGDEVSDVATPEERVGVWIGLSLAFGVVAGLVVAFYLSIVRVWRWTLRAFALLMALGVVSDILDKDWVLVNESFSLLAPSFAVIAVLGIVASAVLATDFAIAMWSVSRAEERASFTATLDRRLVRGPFDYVNRLLDLPRRPFRSWRTAAAYGLHLVAAVALVSASTYLATIGWVESKAQVFLLDPDCAEGACAGASQTEAVSIVVWLALAFMTLKGGAFLQSAARRIGALSVDDVLRRGEDRFILYLRAFSADDVVLPTPRLPWLSGLVSFRPFPARVEEELYDVTDGYLPLIAVGKPGDGHAGGRAYRTYLADDEWREFVLDKIRRADAIVLVLNESEGVRWELERVLDEEAREKTLFFFDPVASDPAVWRRIATTASGAFAERAAALPLSEDARALAFYFEDGALHEIVNENWSAMSYRTAFSTFLAGRADRSRRRKPST